jgi:hypothetical protein
VNFFTFSREKRSPRLKWHEEIRQVNWVGLSGLCDELKAEEKRRSRQFGNGV